MDDMRGDVTPPLPGAPRTERTVLLGALVFGVLADALTSGAAVAGIGITMSVLALVVLLAGLVRVHRGAGLDLPDGSRWLFVAALVVLSLTFAIRDSDAVLASVAFAMFVATVMLSARVVDRRLRELRPTQFLLAAVEWPILSAVRACGIVPRVVRSASDHEERPSRRILGGHGRDIAIGLAIALPLLVVFTALLAAADAGFERIVADLFDWNVAEALEHLLVVGFAALVGATFVIAALATVPQHDDEPVVRSWAGSAVVWIVLGSLAALFALFCVLQAGYLFGGADYLADASDLTAAEYARRGFFELLTVAALVVPVLLVMRAWHADTPGATRAFRVAAPALAVLTILLQLSAFARMWMYQERFGLTEQRVWATLLLAWIAVVLAWYAARIAAARLPELTAFAATSGIFLVVMLAAANPIALVASTNVTRSSTETVDVEYLTTLGADAVPPLVTNIGDLRSHERRQLAVHLLDAYPYAREDWRDWNLARSRADAEIRDARDELERYAHE